MVVLIDLPYENKNLKNKKIHIWNEFSLNFKWSEIFEYISYVSKIPIKYIRIHNNCKIYRFDEINNYPLFKDILNNFRYSNSKTGLFTNDLLINVET